MRKLGECFKLLVVRIKNMKNGVLYIRNVNIIIDIVMYNFVFKVMGVFVIGVGDMDDVIVMCIWCLCSVCKMLM